MRIFTSITGISVYATIYAKDPSKSTWNRLPMYNCVEYCGGNVHTSLAPTKPNKKQQQHQQYQLNFIFWYRWLAPKCFSHFLFVLHDLILQLKLYVHKLSRCSRHCSIRSRAIFSSILLCICFNAIRCAIRCSFHCFCIEFSRFCCCCCSCCCPF